MLIVSETENFIENLSNHRAHLTSNEAKNKQNFQSVLETSLGQLNENSLQTGPVSSSGVNSPISKGWPDIDYPFDEKNPRKPNMRELMEAMSGKNVEDLYDEMSEENWQKISRQASEILYGVVGSNEDTRDWQSIMDSENILTTAREQTEIMYKPEVGIKSSFNETGVIIEQIAFIKDWKGNTLRTLPNNISHSEEILLNFGATKESIPMDLEEQIEPGIFDSNLLTFLKNFDKKPNTIQQVVLHSATEVIANKLSQEIPPDELAKL